MKSLRASKSCTWGHVRSVCTYKGQPKIKLAPTGVARSCCGSTCGKEELRLPPHAGGTKKRSEAVETRLATDELLIATASSHGLEAKQGRTTCTILCSNTYIEKTQFCYIARIFHFFASRIACCSRESRSP